MNEKERILEFVRYKNLHRTAFEKSVGLSNGYLNNLKKSTSTDVLSKIIEAYPELSTEWILFGKGKMIKNESDESINGNGEMLNEISSSEKNDNLPLIPFECIAGYGEDNAGIDLSECETYRIPEFNRTGAEFLVRVGGSSMYPKYSSGDILACRKVKERLFFQWGKST